MAFKQVKLAFILLAFAVPVAFLVGAMNTRDAQVCLQLLCLAALVQYLGLLAERWFFFAQARHPQNLYYQIVS